MKNPCRLAQAGSEDREEICWMAEVGFKTCGSCRFVWPDWRSFVHDPALRMIGLQAIPGLPDSNLLVFEHRCGTSVSVLAPKLRHLLADDGQVDGRTLLFGTESCGGHCLLLADLSSCDRPCINARDRRLAILIADAKGRPPDA